MNEQSKYFVPLSLSYRLSTDLVPDYYNISLWPRLSPDPNTGLYIFTGDEQDFLLMACLVADMVELRVAADGETIV